MSPAEVIGSYHNLWRVEQSFRMSKTDLQARPMFHRPLEAIEAHLTIVFTAVARFIQERTGLAVGNVLKQLRPLQTSTVVINGAVQSSPPEIPIANREILDQLNIDPGY